MVPLRRQGGRLQTVVPPLAPRRALTNCGVAPRPSPSLPFRACVLLRRVRRLRCRFEHASCCAASVVLPSVLCRRLFADPPTPAQFGMGCVRLAELRRVRRLRCRFEHASCCAASVALTFVSYFRCESAPCGLEEGDTHLRWGEVAVTMYTGETHAGDRASQGCMQCGRIVPKILALASEFPNPNGYHVK